MGKYIAAVKAAETISEKTGIPLSDLVDIFAEIPAADVAPVVHAMWIEDRSGIIICSECKRGYNLTAKYTHYCPNCGAKMDGDKEAT